jgi:hypothetical protein
LDLLIGFAIVFLFLLRNNHALAQLLWMPREL